jgi:uncharacterized Zn finger protein
MAWGWDGDWRPYVSAAEKRRRAMAAVKKLGKKGRTLSPVQIVGRQIASTFWGKAWCDNLESYSDYENRLPRGRSYARNGSVVDLQIEAGKVRALVSGSSLYSIEIGIDPVKPARWKRIRSECIGKIDSLVELLQGRLSRSVMEVITRRQEGLFPSPAEINLSCSCPDWAEMCKHVAASLYGVGARLDQQPELLFALRGVDHMELIGAAPAIGITRGTLAEDQEKLLAADSLAEIFGIEMDAAAPVKRLKGKKPSKETTKPAGIETLPIEALPGAPPTQPTSRRHAVPAETLEVHAAPSRKSTVRGTTKRKTPRNSFEEQKRRSLRMKQYWESWRRKKAGRLPKESPAASKKKLSTKKPKARKNAKPSPS